MDGGFIESTNTSSRSDCICGKERFYRTKNCEDFHFGYLRSVNLQHISAIVSMKLVVATRSSLIKYT